MPVPACERNPGGVCRFKDKAISGGNDRRVAAPLETGNLVIQYPLNGPRFPFHSAALSVKIVTPARVFSSLNPLEKIKFRNWAHIYKADSIYSLHYHDNEFKSK
jgi:hypothetical protein